MRARAFTLAETVLVVLLFGLLLGLAGQGIQQYGQLHQRLQGRGQDSLSAGLMLSTLRLEVEQAAQVLVPAVGDLSPQSQLVLSVMDPDVPNTPAALVTVRWSLSGDALQRQSLTIGRGYGDFSCRRIASQELELSLSFDSQGRRLTRRCRVFRPVP